MIKKIEEIWIPVRGFEDLYKVSNSGRIYSIKRDKIKKQSLSKTGKYPVVSLYKDGKTIVKKVHRIVLESFTNISKLQVNHKDGNKLNNNLENLEYCTQRYNLIHARKNGLNKPLNGEDNPNFKYSDKLLNKIIKTLKENNNCYKKTAAIFETNQYQLRALIKRRVPSYYLSHLKR
jgi:hypothetical protein